MFSRQFVLPDAQHAPAVLAERPCHQPVAGLVPCEFPAPERRVVARLRPMLRAAVPEAAIHEHRQPELGKHEIRFAEHGLMTTPAGDPVLPEDAHQSQFSIFVSAPANVRHHLAAPGLGEDVRHGLHRDRLTHRARAGRGRFLSGLHQFLHLFQQQRAKRPAGFLLGCAMADAAPREKVRAIAHIQAVGLLPPDKLEILACAFICWRRGWRGDSGSRTGGHGFVTQPRKSARCNVTSAIVPPCESRNSTSNPSVE